MVQVDLITGFLGSGKTTFLRKYVQYLIQQGHNVCILENDFGAVNVDAMLLQDLIGARCDIETISGGCDCDTHQRRMRTKLISMAMRGFDRVVIEPSGIFDVDEFYDILRDEPLDRWYALGNVVAIVDARLEDKLSPQAEYLLASEAASAGLVVMSRAQQASCAQAEAVVAHLNRALAACRCPRRFGDDVLCKDWAAHTLLQGAGYGHILRIKGFIPENGGWLELNAARDAMTLQPIPNGQEVLIVIGEGLDKAAIEAVVKLL